MLFYLSFGHWLNNIIIWIQYRLLIDVDVQCLEELHSLIFNLNLIFLCDISLFLAKHGTQLLEVDTRLSWFLLHLLLFHHDLLLLEQDLETV